MRRISSAAPAVHHIIRSQLLLPVHAHIERRILHVGKAALGMIQLWRGNAEVEQNAVRTCKSLPSSTLSISRKSLDRCDTLPHILEAVLRVFECFVISVNANQTTGIMQTLRNAERVTAPPVVAST